MNVVRSPALFAILVACAAPPDTVDDTGDSAGSVDTGTASAGEGAVVAEVTVDATDAEAFVYFDLDNGVVLTDPGVADTTDWTLAMRRFEILTNGGTSGPGDVTAGLGVAQDDFYDADGEPLVDAFLDATPESELEHLLSEIYLPTLSADEVASVFGEDWYIYDPGTSLMSPNDANGWLVRSGEGDAYARVRVTALDFPTREGNGIQSFTVEVELDTKGGFAAPLTFEGSVPGEGGSVCYDMDADANVDCTGAAWDLQLGFTGFTTFLYTNSGAIGEGEGGALGPYAWSELSNWTSATTDPKGQDLTPWFEEDVSQSIFSTESWYAYNLQGMRRLYPNYRVYVVDPGQSSPTYALQVIDYYDENEVSGHLTLRWVEL